MKGKKLTREQRQLLSSEGIMDTDNWIYLKTLQIPCDDGGLSHNKKKLIQLLFENIQTGQQVAVSVGGYK